MSSTNGKSKDIGADRAALEELSSISARLCTIASSGHALMRESINGSEDAADLMVASLELFGLVGYLAERAARLCGDPGIKEHPESWILSAMPKSAGVSQ